MTQHAVPEEPNGESHRIEHVVEMALNSRILIPVTALLLAAVLSFFGYAVHAYVSTECYTSIHQAELDQELGVLFDDVQDVLVDLRKGTPDLAKWRNKEFQEQLRESNRAISEARHALSRHEGFAAINATETLETSLSAAKRIATNRVNDIIAKQDPTDFDAFEKYRLEGKQLVATVKVIDSALETLGGRSQKWPSICTW